MDSDGELDIVEQAERDAVQEDVEDEEETQEVQREVNDDDVEEVEADGNDDETARKVIKPKRIVRNPQPKLNADTLRGPRGLTALQPLFAKQKFKGKGHEESDLNVILQTYQYWCHRLFPKMRFDQCIEKIETLGSKKQVMTYVKRIRMGILDEEPVELRENVVSDDETDATPQQQQEIETIESRFDAFAQNTDKPKESELTEEQKEIIRFNRERAMNMRAERLRRIQEQAESKLGKSSLLDSQSTSLPENSEKMDNTTSEKIVKESNTSEQQNSEDLFGNEDEESEFMALSNQVSGQIVEEQEEEIDVDEMLSDLQSTTTNSTVKSVVNICDDDNMNFANNMEVDCDSNVHNNAS